MPRRCRGDAQEVLRRCQYCSWLLCLSRLRSEGQAGLAHSGPLSPAGDTHRPQLWPIRSGRAALSRSSPRGFVLLPAQVFSTGLGSFPLLQLNPGSFFSCSLAI